MKILVIGYYYSWSSSVGSRRVRGLVQGLVADGHDVTVLCARPPDGVVQSAPDGVTVLATPATDRVATARRLIGSVRGRSPQTTPAPSSVAEHEPSTSSSLHGAKTALRTAARRWVGFPDTMWEWTYRAQRAAHRAGLRPDVIIASAPPMAAVHTASRIAARTSCPWIADMRDLWTGDPYRIAPPSVRWLDRRMERRVLASAAAITTVANSLADDLRIICPHLNVTSLRNGFDREWLRLGDDPPQTPATIVFTGTLTSNTGRSLEPLCNVAAALDATGDPLAPVIEIIGAVDRGITDLVSRRGLGHRIRFRGTVPGADARQAQHAACALLNFSWEDPRDYSKMPAKLFEYAAARRPVIHLGTVETLGTLLIAHHHLGYVMSPDDPAAVATLMTELATGNTRWTPPTVDDLVPLSQLAMVDGFRKVIDDVTRR